MKKITSPNTVSDSRTSDGEGHPGYSGSRGPSHYKHIAGERGPEVRAATGEDERSYVFFTQGCSKYLPMVEERLKALGKKTEARFLSPKNFESAWRELEENPGSCLFLVDPVTGGSGLEPYRDLIQLRAEKGELVLGCVYFKGSKYFPMNNDGLNWLRQISVEWQQNPRGWRRNVHVSGFRGESDLAIVLDEHFPGPLRTPRDGESVMVSGPIYTHDRAGLVSVFTRLANDRDANIEELHVQVAGKRACGWFSASFPGEVTSERAQAFLDELGDVIPIRQSSPFVGPTAQTIQSRLVNGVVSIRRLVIPNIPNVGGRLVDVFKTLSLDYVVDCDEAHITTRRKKRAVTQSATLSFTVDLLSEDERCALYSKIFSTPTLSRMTLSHVSGGVYAREWGWLQRPDLGSGRKQLKK